MESEQFLSKEEFIKLYRAAKDDRERCLLQLMAGTGLRVGEMVQIRIEDIDFDNAYLHIRAENAKYKKARTVVLLPPVIDVLQRLVAGRSSGWLFPGYKKGHLSKPHVERILQDIAVRSGLQQIVHPDRKGPGRYRIHPHMLRHSFAIFSIEAGIPLSDLQAQLGHASLATTGVYLKASPNHRREAYMRSEMSSFLTEDAS
jgi:integrase/recombinase XerD